MITTFQSLLIVVLLFMNFLLLGTARTQPLLRYVMLQSIFTTIAVVLFTKGQAPLETAVVVAVLILDRWLLLPFLMQRALKLSHISAAMKPLINPAISLLLLTAVLGLAFWCTGQFPLPTRFEVPPGILPAAFLTLFAGCFLMMARFLAFSQVVGFLVFCNGIVLYTAALDFASYAAIPMILMLDLFGAVLLAGVIVFDINGSFDQTHAVDTEAPR